MTKRTRKATLSAKERLAAAVEAMASIAREVAEQAGQCASPDEALAILEARVPGFTAATKEMFVALYLDGRRRVIAHEVVSIGTATATLVHPREVFRPAIACGAVSLVVAHNHPSGNPNPSTEDRLLTKRLKNAGTLLGIGLDDHLVVGTQGFFSFRKEYLL